MLRFLWLKNPGDLSSEILELRFCRLVFGLRPSPAILGATIIYHLNAFKENHPKASEIVELIKDSSYVDDFISGADCQDKAFNIYQEAKGINHEQRRIPRQKMELESKTTPEENKWSWNKRQRDGRRWSKNHRKWSSSQDTWILLGANILPRLINTVKDSLPSKKQIESAYWIDSLTMLLYIRHRVEEILKLTSKEEWRFCPGNLNPADIPFRGLKGQDLVESKVWCMEWYGVYAQDRHRMAYIPSRKWHCK